MRGHYKTKGGYTLVEVIVAAGIFAMVIAGGIAGVQMGFHAIENARHHTRVSQILQSEVESLRSLSWKELNRLPANAEIDISSEFSTSAYNAYTVERRILEESPTLRRVEVVVSYTARRGNSVNLKYLTFFTDGGVNDYSYRII